MDAKISSELLLCQGNFRSTMILIGGFLGAGKTTLIGALVRHFQGLGLRCAVVSNDQAGGLVDGVSARLSGAEQVAEVSGACFCCKLEELVAIVERLTARERPDVILAEPVGSCTDLMATVVAPLEKVYQARVTMAPYLVLVDSRRALAAFGGKAGARVRKREFSRDVGYIFRKQIEEAQCVFVNKAEMITPAGREAIRAGLQEAWTDKQVVFGSARRGDGLEDLMGVLSATSAEASLFMDVNYPLYTRGEALLGWYNAELELQIGTQATPASAASWNEWLEGLARPSAEALAAAGYEVAHFKMSLEGSCGDAAIINQVFSGDEPSLSREMLRDHKEVTLLINLRAEGEAAGLRDIVRQHLTRWCCETQVSCKWRAEDFFQPGAPVPSHRMSNPRSPINTQK